ncbi:MAG TPA: SDR family oxidoreductase [Opitutaceae bacterium]
MSAPLAALVTGASRGIGAAIARALAARGVRVAVHYQRNETAARSTLASLAGTGHGLVRGDLSDAAGAESVWTAANEALGSIALLINNAGIYETHAPLTTDFAAWQQAWTQTLGANLIGPAHLSFLAAKAMSARDPVHAAHGRGRIVNISSRGAFRGEPDAPAYGASKAGLNALGQSLARALAPQAIYVFAVAPGWVATDMAADHLAGPAAGEILAQHPLGRVTDPEEIACTAVFCGLDAPAAMTGAIIDVNGASYLRT